MDDHGSSQQLPDFESRLVGNDDLTTDHTATRRFKQHHLYIYDRSEDASGRLSKGPFSIDYSGNRICMDDAFASEDGSPQVAGHPKWC